MLTGKFPLNYLEQDKGMKRTLWFDKGNTEQEFVTWVNSIGREEWTSKVFDNCMKWAKNNEIEMIDLMDIGLRCCESDVSRRWDMKKVQKRPCIVFSNEAPVVYLTCLARKGISVISFFPSTSSPGQQ
ncbi:pollen receptor-like kinase 4 [Tanacetum coccineum]